MSNSDKLIAELQSLIEINSHTYNSAGVSQVGEKIQEMLSGCELDWQRFPHRTGKYGDLFYARSKNWDSTLPHLALNGHLDTVFKNHDQFDIRAEGGKLYGPGAVDMKGGLLVIVEALRRLQSKNLLSNISLILTADEEIQETDSFPIMADLIKGADYLLVFEGDGSRESEPDYRRKSLVVQRKGFVYSKLIAKATGGHSGVKTDPSERHSAVHELIQQGARILELADFPKQTTVNLGIFKGGIAVNALATDAELHFDARVINNDEFSRITKAYDALSEKKFDEQVELDYQRVAAVPPMPYTKLNTNFFIEAKKAASTIGVELSEEFRGGGSDANRLCPHNEQMAVLDNFGPVGFGEHSSGEFVYIGSLEPNIKLAEAVIKQILKKNNI